MNFSNSVRATLELGYEDEIRDLNVTFDLIDRVRQHVPWEQLAIEMAKPNPVPDLTMMSKFVYLNLREAGFSPDIDKIYNEMFKTDEAREGYMAVVSHLLLAYQPTGSSKKKSLLAPTVVEAVKTGT